MTRVVNCKHEKYDIYIGRGSKWGNPYPIGPVHGNRAQVIAKYRRYILTQHNLLEDIRAGELHDKIIGCHCVPLPCHGDILVELDRLAREGKLGPWSVT